MKVGMAEFIKEWADWIPVVQSVFMFLTVVCAVVTVWLAFRKQNTDRIRAADAIEENAAQARKRAIIDLLIAQKSDPNYIRDSKIVRALKDNKEISLAAEVRNPQSPVKDAVLSVLNQLEFIAVGIRVGVFDEELYKELSCHSLIKSWEAASGFVYELRHQTGIKTLYQDLEKLACRWKKDTREFS